MWSMFIGDDHEEIQYQDGIQKMVEKKLLRTQSLNTINPSITQKEIICNKEYKR